MTTDSLSRSSHVERERSEAAGGAVGSEKCISHSYVAQVDSVEGKRLRTSKRRGELLEQCLRRLEGRGA